MLVVSVPPNGVGVSNESVKLGDSKSDLDNYNDDEDPFFPGPPWPSHRSLWNADMCV